MKNNNHAWAYAIIIIAFTSCLFIHSLRTPNISKVVDNSLKESVITIQDVAESQKESTRKAIDEAINKALLGESLEEKESKNSSKSDSLSSYVQNSIENSKVNSNTNSEVEIKEVISSNKIKLIYKGEEKTVRLIGVGPNGKKEHLQFLLDNAKNNLQIETDTKKNDEEYMLVYLWDGEPSDVENMINIQMIKNNFATCTYNAGTTIIEQPNIKYFGDFIDATK